MKNVVFSISTQAGPKELLASTGHGRGCNGDELWAQLTDQLREAILDAVCPLCNGAGVLGFRAKIACPQCGGSGWANDVTGCDAVVKIETLGAAPKVDLEGH